MSTSRRGWVRVIGKGDKERSVPLDPDVAGAIQTYLFAERPESDADALFLVAKGPHRGKPLTPAGLRTVFRYHRTKAGVPAGHPHALRHSFGTALAEAGVDLAVLQALMGHDHVDSSPPTSICPRRMCAPPTMPPVIASAPAEGLPRGGRRQAASSCWPVTWPRWPPGVRGIDRFSVRPARSWPAGPIRSRGPTSRYRCGCRPVRPPGRC